MTDDEPDEVTVDLSADDDATLDELQSEGDEPPEPEPEVSEDELLERAQEEAARLRDAADGDSQSEQVANAIEGAMESYQQNSQILQKMRSNVTDLDQRIERLEMTRERVVDQPDRLDIVQTLAGGVSMEVPPDSLPTVDGELEEDEDVYTRTDLVGEIDETVSALDEKVEETKERADNLQLDLEKLEKAIDLLQKLSDRLEDQPPDPDEWIDDQVNGTRGGGDTLPSGRAVDGPR